MIRINQLKLPVGHSERELWEKTAKLLRINPEQIRKLYIRRQSLDARKKPELFYSYVVDVEAAGETRILCGAKKPQIVAAPVEHYHFPVCGETALPGGNAPVIIGSGPAGLFAALMLARHGYRPRLFERGEDVDTRRGRVDAFWAGNSLDLRSNVQFGEGGAGTFSDGKLNTLVKDPAGRNRLVLEIFHEHGADEEILWKNKPHIGTDVLAGVVKHIREEIIRLEGEIQFGCQITDLVIRDGSVAGVVTEDGRTVDTGIVVLAIGHSARDTFSMLLKRGVPMSPKPFAVGLRIQHPQRLINVSQYGREQVEGLGAADYKLSVQTTQGRGVYSFCMCPGGYVVNASSEAGRLAVNGMSYHDRSGKNANSALIVTVTPQDFPDNTALGGVHFQQRLEERAFMAGDGQIPLQLYEDFCANRKSCQLGDVAPQMKGGWRFANLRAIMPEPLNAALLEAMPAFGRKISGFDRADALFAGVESRTSSPVRIERDENLESAVHGLFPCGEGAGYAGGITSAAMDGVRVAEAIAARWHP